MVYIVAIMVVFLLKLCCSKAKVITQEGRAFSRGLIIFMAFTFLFILSATRDYDVGLDTLNYAEKYRMIHRYSFRFVFTHVYTERVEFGYAILCKLLSEVFASPRIMIVLSSAVVCYGMAFYLYRYTDDDSMAVIILVCCGMYLQSLNLARQIMACAFLMNAWGKLTEKKYWHSGLLFFLGISMHITAAIFAVVYYFYAFRRKKIVVLVSFVLSLLVAAFYRPLLALVARFTDQFGYLDNSGSRISAGGIWAVWAVELFLAVFFVISYLKSKKMRFLPRQAGSAIECEDMICIPIFVVYYIIFTFLGTQFNNLDRFGLYFMPFTVPLFLNYGKILKERFPKLHMVYEIGVQVCFAGLFILASRAQQYQFSFGW